MATEDGGWTSFLTQASEAWLENCNSFSGGTQAIAGRWLATCSDQIQSNLDAWTQLAGCKDTAEATAIQQRWWQGTADRLSAEIKDYQDQMTALSQRGFAAFGQTKPARQPRSHHAKAA
jgi:hypothetical protein